MRCVLIAGLGLAGLAGGAAAQVGPGARYPEPGMRNAPPPMHVAPRARMDGRWGTKIDGRWSAGANAPGGYAAYRRPVRGAAVPTYWNAPRFYVTDWQAHGLLQPPVGYNWVRYYDDAVLLDARGSVYDTEFGVDWDRLDRGPTYAGDRIDRSIAYRSDGYASDGYGRSSEYTATVPAGGSHVVHAGPGVTTVTVQTQPVITTRTTTTEYVDEAVTYSRPAGRAYRSKLRRR